MEANQKGWIEICIWPDNSWLLRDDYSEEDWQWRGDDVRVVPIPPHLEEDDIDTLLQRGEL